jgi:hypothetical protein
MYHHGQETYEVAASQAAIKGREKMEAIIQQGVASAEQVINQVQSRIVKDSVVRAKGLQFHYGNQNLLQMRIATNETFNLHNLAQHQVLEDADIPKRFHDRLSSHDWGRNLMATNLNCIYGNSPKRHLIRAVDNEVRGFLSDRFRRLDSRPLLDSFIGACQKYGMVPIQGHTLDTKVRMRAALPQVFEPIPNEVMMFGLEWGNSDFGDGGHQVSLWIMRVWCTNLAIGEQVLRQVHLGRTLHDDIEYSQKTYDYDTKTNASALADIVRHSISPARVNGYLDVIRQSTEEEIKGRDGALSKLKKLMDKGTAEKAADLFASPDVVNLPQGDNNYRLSNAVSWLAQAKDTKPERRLELEQIAGDLLGKPKNKMRAIEV